MYIYKFLTLNDMICQYFLFICRKYLGLSAKVKSRNSVQSHLAKGHIATLSPLVTANGFVWPWPYVIHGFLDESVVQTASQTVQPFLQSWLCDQHRHRLLPYIRHL